jgi:hypothetical protein
MNYAYLLILIIPAAFAAILVALRRYKKWENQSLTAAKRNLIQDGQHDIKNALQIISSMVRTAIRQSEGDAEGGLSKVNRRVTSIGLMHNHLAVCDNVLCLYFDNFVQDLVDGLESATDKLTITTKMGVHSPPLAYRAVTPLGLSVVECLADLSAANENGVLCISYEQSDDRSDGRISITFSYQGNEHLALFDENDGVFAQQYMIDLLRQTGMQTQFSYGENEKTVRIAAPVVVAPSKTFIVNQPDVSHRFAQNRFLRCRPLLGDAEA